MVLSDVAGHWRRLRLWAGWRSATWPADFLVRRLTTRAKQWREDQIYEVEVRVPATAAGRRAPRPRWPGAATRLGKAALLPGTERVQQRPRMAEAAIAWEHACRRAAVAPRSAGPSDAGACLVHARLPAARRSRR